MSFLSFSKGLDKPNTIGETPPAGRKRGLLLVIMGSAVVLLGLVTAIATYLQPVPVLAEAPWLVPVVDSFIVLVSASVAFLALGRYPVLRTPVSYWIGIGFLAFALLIIFRYIFFAPMMVGAGALSQPARYNVFVWFSLLTVSVPTIYLLAGVVAPWPRGRALEGSRLLLSVIVWFVAASVTLILMVAFPGMLPVLYDPLQSFVSPLIFIWEGAVVLLFWGGAVLSVRRYLRSGDDLPGYVALVQVILGIAMVTILLSRERYDLWWYLQRVLATGGYLALMFGLLTEYVEGFKRERESEARYRQLTESLPQLIWTSTPNGHCDYLSPQWLAYTGKPLSAQLGYGWLDQVMEADREMVQAAWNATVQSGSQFDVEYRLRRHDGVYRWFKTLAVPIRDMSGEIVRWFGSNTDIDDQKRYQQALRESEERYRQLADAMPQLVWTATPDGVIDYYNQRYQEYGGIYPDEQHEWQSVAAIHPDDQTATLDAWEEAKETGQPYQVECRLKTAAGEYRWHLVRAVRVCDESGQPLRWYGTSTDIHDLKEAKNALQSYTAELERSNRDLQEFAYVASHDLHEPLRKIEAFGDAIQDQANNLTGRQQEYLSRMRKSAGRMRRMVDGLLQLSRLSTNNGHFEAVDLRQVVREALVDLELQVQQSGAVIDVGDLPAIYADATQMRRLFQNLIGNAIKFQPAGARPQVRVSAHKNGSGNVEILVEDNGVGFNDAYVEQMFQPFKRLVGRNEYDGSGIGLAICRRIVERHSGTITARSQEGQGATFIVSLLDRLADGVHPNLLGMNTHLRNKKTEHGEETFVFDR